VQDRLEERLDHRHHPERRLATYLRPYAQLGFQTFLLMERTPLDYETLRLFMQQVVPRLKEAVSQSS